MFSFFKKKPAPASSTPPAANDTSAQMRELLFGDLPLERWTGDSTGAPWSEFARAQTLLQNGDKTGATAVLQGIVQMSDVESRHTLQAWHFLRELGVQPPPEIAKQVLGVVIEVGMDKGLDVLAAYRDHQARYWNWSGAGVVWEHPDGRFDPAIDELLTTGQQVASIIGPWDKARPAPVTKDKARMNFLTPSGLHFGEGTFSVMMRDPLAAPIINNGAELMKQMTDMALGPETK